MNSGSTYILLKPEGKERPKVTVGSEENKEIPVSYTHLDVYKRQEEYRVK